MHAITKSIVLIGSKKSQKYLVLLQAPSKLLLHNDQVMSYEMTSSIKGDYDPPKTLHQGHNRLELSSNVVFKHNKCNANKKYNDLYVI